MELQELERSTLFSIKDKIERELAKSIFGFGEKTKLRDACEYALKSGGKRFRPLIVYLVADALGQGHDVRDGALAVEFFHTSSLIIDDLPCMDDDDERRNKPSLHKVYGESTALLASYALMIAGFEKIHFAADALKALGDSYAKISDRIGQLALALAAERAGILGATGGQFLDLFPEQRSLEVIKKIIHKKTITLFEVSFIFGWIFGGGNPESVDEIARIAGHFGLAFQIADDMHDLLQDEKKQRDTNIVRFLGRERTLQIFTAEFEEMQRGLTRHQLMTASFKKLCSILENYKEIR